MNKPLSATLLKKPIHFLALGFGSGLEPKAPGTAGTVMAIPLYLLLQMLSMELYIAAVVIICLAGIYICDQSSKLMGVHDHPGIVWDEFAGFFITMIAVPFSWLWILVGFGLFRFFDIVKPWPIRVIDRKVQGGFGIMLDDIIAGVFAAICLQLIIWISINV